MNVVGDNISEMDVFIIETLKDGETRGWSDGEILKNQLLLATANPIYKRVQNKGELEEALKQFKDSNYRNLHFIAHGGVCGGTFSLGDKDSKINVEELILLLRKYAANIRMTISACSIGKVRSNSLKKILVGCQGRVHSVAGFVHEVNAAPASLCWLCYYTNLHYYGCAMYRKRKNFEHINNSGLAALLERVSSITMQKIRFCYRYQEEGLWKISDGVVYPRNTQWRMQANEDVNKLIGDCMFLSNELNESLK